MGDYMSPEVHHIMDAMNNGRLPREANEVVKFGSVVMTEMGLKAEDPQNIALYELLVSVALFVNQNFTWLGTRDMPEEQ